jgi:hypothetical protein
MARRMWHGCSVCVVQRQSDNCYRPAILDFVMNHSRLFAALNEVILSTRSVNVG